ncbi:MULTISPECIES: NAD(P)/FAD-dependent oxidoreductase [Niastella]|uniref:FAD-binding oxidoreductase n=1 Tax=Niastella soli TaxID=2821487 RepID=A0ABS3YWA7_9BACT|nr:FAD-dependent oxidoreductase [Niastella soli]MBO9202200.1 FAD-binding oxidoreductase [Niastella soli]
MDLRSEYPFWLLDKGIIHSYPSLQNDLRTDVVIMGAGISGALAAWCLVHAGFKTVVVDKRHVGMGSTAASTALLQYEIDTPLTELIGLRGERDAVRSYLLCLKAIDDLENICGQWPEAGFTRHPSLQFASYKKDVAALEREFTLRKQYGFALQWLDKNAINDKFGFKKEAALLSRDGAAIKAYSLTHALLHRCRQLGVEVYDHTAISHFRENQRGVALITEEGKKIRARKLVIACGYESAQYIPQKVQTLQSTYAIISEACNTNQHWYRNALIWETARPYLYLRTTADNRILVGGRDDDFSSPYLRDRALPAKARALETTFRKLFPHIRFRTDFKWAGTFASTKDGLPYIGSLPGKPHTYFALGLGGNGITFSIIAAQIITRLALGLKDDDARLFGFNRS